MKTHCQTLALAGEFWPRNSILAGPTHLLWPLGVVSAGSGDFSREGSPGSNRGSEYADQSHDQGHTTEPLPGHESSAALSPHSKNARALATSGTMS